MTKNLSLQAVQGNRNNMSILTCIILVLITSSIFLLTTLSLLYIKTFHSDTSVHVIKNTIINLR